MVSERVDRQVHGILKGFSVVYKLRPCHGMIYHGILNIDPCFPWYFTRSLDTSGYHGLFRRSLVMRLSSLSLAADLPYLLCSLFSPPRPAFCFSRYILNVLHNFLHVTNIWQIPAAFGKLGYDVHIEEKKVAKYR